MNLTLTSIFLIFVLLFSLAYLLPRLVIRLIAIQFDWSISWQETSLLYTHHCYSISFLKTAKEIQALEDVSVQELCQFHLASGNMKELKSSIEKLKMSCISYDIKTLTTILLAKRNLNTIIENIGSERKLNFSTIIEARVRI